MTTIIRAYKNKNDFSLDKPLDFRFCCTNENDDFEPTFVTHYMQGIMEGMRCRYVAPYVAAFRINSDGTKKLVTSFGGQNLRH